MDDDATPIDRARSVDVVVRDVRAGGRARTVTIERGVTTATETIARALGRRATSMGALVLRELSGTRMTYAGTDVVETATTTGRRRREFAIAPRRLGLFGGGGDGGSTGAESRSSYLEMYADPARRRKESLGGFVRYSTQSTVMDRDVGEEDLARWFTCALTEEPLERGENGVVIDRLGALYNKEPVLKALRDKAVDGVALPKRVEHITGMKALVTCKFTKRPGEGAAKASVVNARDFRSGAIDAVFACPITGLDFSGKTKFLVMRPSGVVVADKALREAKAAVEEMNDGLKLADAPPPIPVNPRGEELEALKALLEDEKANKDSKKKSKKDKSGNDDGPKRKSSAEDGVTKTKKYKAIAPANADASVYASIFTSSSKPEENNDDHFLARNARKAW
ncbi:Replication termination factor 2, RING-finger [Ostreococcus tauri]|uniref:Replication termination factor 2, RING-finger n=2 Tax=Ostreococcus tauri TaxID=70448 RepID=A0A090M3X4_OSTTA|nr:Replication termination factor 2, RING-finger [Ostreococcus tauri]CEF98881.1 Replication termination factor 2, RING-finger [Ostreococcus tauri]|eukprot:XP_003080554.2 Replication termination factor 2, RING-finger [Ostreococcus tauri]